MRFITLSTVAVVLICAPVALAGDDNTGERVGRKVDQAVEKLREGAEKAVDQVRQGFEEARKVVDRLGIEGRVYARLHWDKALNGASVSVEVANEGVATIRGTVPDEASKAKAEQLTNDTVGVQRVVNELQIAPTAAK